MPGYVQSYDAHMKDELFNAWDTKDCLFCFCVGEIYRVAKEGWQGNQT